MKRWKIAAGIVPIATAVLLTGCGGNGTTSNGSGSGKTTGTPSSASTVMTIGCDNGSPTLTDNFNPFSPNARYGIQWIYETLYSINAQNGNQTPWLATDYKWTKPTELTFTIRQGIKWSDGQPFSADDVAYTFNLMKQNSALDANGLWSGNILKSVTATDPNTVVFDFQTPDIPAFTYICNTMIVPKHIWANIKDPVKDTNVNPVGTGAFMLDQFTPQQYTLKKNPTYWQADKVVVTKLVFPAMTGNDTDNMNLVAGKFDWAQLFVPNIDQVYVKKDSQNNHYWFAPGGPSNLVMDDSKYPFNQVAFRQAMEYGIDRNTVSQKGEYGYQPPADPTGLTLPGNSNYVDPQYQGAYAYDPAKAQSLLSSIGMTKNGSGQLVDKNGKAVTFSIDVPTGYTDWIQSAKIISDDLAKLGITVNVQTPSVDGWYNQLQTGQFDMSLTYGANFYDPWFYYDMRLGSENTAPIGKLASSNFERWNDPATDKLLHQYMSESDPAQQKTTIQQLEKIMIDQVPLIPLFYNANWNEYSTKNFVGWPDAQNPYATPSFLAADNEVIFTHLKLAH